jgi:7-cyano-7-deazaguanine reductase
MNKNIILLEDAVKRGLLPGLETFPCPYDGKPSATGVIRIMFPEFTCVCPRTGYPDFAKITVCYLPGNLCLELKSWKLYLNSFRMTGAFHEAVTAHLFETLKRTLTPEWLLIIGKFSPRGNVNTTVVFETPGTRPAGADLLIASPSPHNR